MNLRTENTESLAWQAERDAAASAYLAALPARTTLTDRVARHLVDTRRLPVTRRGARWFQAAVLEPSAEHPVVVVRDAPAGEPRVLVDPNELSAKRGVPTALAWFVPSPDGSVLAYAVTAAGTEVAEVSLIDVATGDMLPEDIPWCVNFPVSWLPDSSGFWCAGREVVDGVFRMPIYRYVLGTPAGAEIPTPDGLVFPYPVVSKDGRHIALASGNTEPRIDWIWREDEFVPFLRDIDGMVAGRFAGDDLVAVVDSGAPRGRLVRIPVATAADSSTWTELVAESADVLRYADVVDDVIVLGYLRNAVCRVRLLELDGRVIDELALPGDGVVSTYPMGAAHPSLPMFDSGDGEISFVFSTFDTSPAVYRYVVSERRLDVVTPPAMQLDNLTVTIVTATSADGSEIPAHVVHRADL
ncbi:MAG TPA: hypothetical protein VKJ07_04145, partial [Mycobacteriales bacterium]|nr:hypothetical protein [Mycobacteriales bacterium]